MSEPPFFCSICHIQCNSAEQLSQHKGTASHVEKMKKVSKHGPSLGNENKRANNSNNIVTVVTSFEDNKQIFLDHVKPSDFYGVKYKEDGVHPREPFNDVSKLGEARSRSSPELDFKGIGYVYDKFSKKGKCLASTADSTKVTLCSLCKVPLSGKLNVEQHFEGVKHRKKEQMRMKQQALLAGREEEEMTKKKEFVSHDNFTFNGQSTPTSVDSNTPSRQLNRRLEPSVIPTNPHPTLNQPYSIDNCVDKMKELDIEGNNPGIYKRSMSDNWNANNDSIPQLKVKDKLMTVSSAQMRPASQSQGTPFTNTLSSITDNSQLPNVVEQKASLTNPFDEKQNHQFGNNVVTVTPGSTTARKFVDSSGYVPQFIAPIERHRNDLTPPRREESPVRTLSPEQFGNEKEYDFDSKSGTCNVCKVHLTSLKLAQQHLNGEPHKKKLEQWKWKLSIRTQSPKIENNTVHASLYASSSNMEKPSPTFDNMSGQPKKRSSQDFYYSNGVKYCLVDNTELSSPLQTKDHFEGKLHKRAFEMLQNKKQDGYNSSLWCEICHKSFSGQVSATQHFSSEKHKLIQDLLHESTQVLEIREDAKKLFKDGKIWYFCNSCRKPLNTEEQLNIHKKSPNHLTALGSIKGRPASNNIPLPQPGENFEVRMKINETAQHGLDSPQLSETSGGRHYDSEDKMNQIRELLTFGKDPVVNTDFSSNLKQNTLPDIKLQSGNAGSKFYNRQSEYEQKVEANIGFGGSNLTQCDLESDSSRTKRSPESNTQPFEFRYTSNIAANIGQNQSDWRGNRSSNGNIQSNANTDNSKLHSCVTATSPGDESPTERPQTDREVGNQRDSDLSSYLGKVIGPKKTSRSKATGGRTRNTMSLDRVDNENESFSDQDDDDDDQGDQSYANMNIQEEKVQSASQCSAAEQSQKPSVAPISPVTNKKNYCSICEKQMNGRKSFKEHNDGSNHQWNLASQKALPLSQKPIMKNPSVNEFPKLYDMVKTAPRNYQLTLLEKAMESDCVVYLPTGTGKTMVSILAIALMLENNPNRPVIFLVDKVLLVIQQAQYIKSEFEGQKFKRARVQGQNEEIVERELTCAAVCGDLLHTTKGFSLWQHDIIITTVDYCINMLKKKTILWENFGLAVFDEVHHCVKKHPFNRLIQAHHSSILDPEKRPKILGLTASPAGKSSLDATYKMLKDLLESLGCARLAFIPEDNNELKSYQAIPNFHSIYVPLSSKGKFFLQHCIRYFLECYVKFVPMSKTLKNTQEPPCSYFHPVCHDKSEESFKKVTDCLLQDDEPLTEILPCILYANFDDNDDDNGELDESTFATLRDHIVDILLHIGDIPTGINLKHLKKTFEESSENEVIQRIKVLGLPCEEFYRHILNFEQEEGTREPPMVESLTQILKDSAYIDWSKKESTALVLVRERAGAKSLSKHLRSKQFIEDNKLRVTALVGHGKGAVDGGMHVKKQKHVLDNQKEYNIIVATSIAEEGLDIQGIQLVVCMNPPSNVTAFVQMRGRTRRQASHFVILCSNEEDRKKLSELELHEKNMMAAVKECAQGQ